MRLNRRLVPRELKEAFTLIRSVLEKSPRQFKQIITRGIVLHPTGVEHARRLAAASAQARDAKKAVSEQSVFDSLMRVKEVAASQDTKTLDWARMGFPPKVASQTGTSIPKGHPFISSTVLRQRILPLLLSHRLIEVSKERDVSGGRKDSAKAKAPYLYRLIPFDRPRAPGMSVKQYWDALLADPGHGHRLLSETDGLLKKAHRRGTQLTAMDPELWGDMKKPKKKGATKKARRKLRQKEQWAQFLAQRPIAEWEEWERKKRHNGQLGLALATDHLKTRKRKKVVFHAERESAERLKVAAELRRIQQQWRQSQAARPSL